MNYKMRCVVILKLILVVVCIGACITPLHVYAESPDSHYIEVELRYQRDKKWCGPASICMILCYWNFNVTVEEIGASVDEENDGCKTTELVRYLEGFEVECFELNDTKTLKQWISRNHPVLVLIWSDSTKTSGHFLVCCGFNDTKHEFYLNDPNGIRVEFSYEKFSDLWTRQHNYGLVISPIRSFLTDPYENRTISIIP